MSEEEVERRWQERIELIRAVKRRNYLKKMGIDGETLGLGDAVIVAKTIEKTQKELRKELGREMRLAPRRGRRNQTTVERRIAKEKARQEREYQAAFNPKFRAKGVPGLKPDENGYVRLQDAKRDRPDLFNRPSKGKEVVTNLIRKHQERKNGTATDRPEGSGSLPAQTQEGSSELHGLHGLLPPGTEVGGVPEGDAGGS